MSTRSRLLEALKAIARAPYLISFKTGFEFLARYLAGTGKNKDAELAKAFKDAGKAMSEGSSKS
jgi:hypothetical protein